MGVVYKLDYISFLLKSGTPDQGEKVLLDAIKTHPEFEEYSTPRALLFAMRGAKKEALSIQKSVAIYSLLHMQREALHLLEEKAGRSREYLYVNLLRNPFFNNLRDDPQFRSLLAKQKELYEERERRYGDL
jgi:hypothetical protein